MVICLERGADLHMAQLMPLPLTISCSSKIQIGFTFLVPTHLGSPGQRAVKRVCVWSGPVRVLVLSYRSPRHWSTSFSILSPPLKCFWPTELLVSMSHVLESTEEERFGFAGYPCNIQKQQRKWWKFWAWSTDSSKTWTEYPLSCSLNHTCGICTSSLVTLSKTGYTMPWKGSVKLAVVSALWPFCPAQCELLLLVIAGAE